MAVERKTYKSAPLRGNAQEAHNLTRSAERSSDTVDACARLGGLICQAGASDFEHGIQPGPVFHFDGGAIGLDLRFGDPDADGRAVEAIAEGFAALGWTLGGEGRAPIISGGS